MKISIKTKLLASLLGTTLLVMIIFFFISDEKLRDISKIELERMIVLLGNNTAQSVQRALFNQDYNRLGNIVKPVLLDEFDYFVVLDNVTGKTNIVRYKDKNGIFASLDSEELIKEKKEFEKSNLTLSGINYWQFVFPVKGAGMEEPIGFIFIGLPDSAIKSKLREITNRLIVLNLLLFMALALAIYFFSGKIVEPIKKLSGLIQKFAAGNYQIRSDIKSKDEIGVLSKNFNILAAKLNEQMDSIEKNSKNLEKMIKVRTKKLAKVMAENQEKELRLNRAEQISSLNSLVSSIAHEINNPIAIISGNIQMLAIKNKNDHEPKRLKTISNAIQRIDNLINEINFFSSISDVTLLSLSFSKLLLHIQQEVVPENVKVNIKSEGDDRINSNPNLLTAIMKKILQNSIEIFQHRQVQGVINISYYRKNNNFHIEVSDNGGGVEDIKHIFEPFHTTFNDKKGLGLTFVYHAVHSLNGEVTVENSKEGILIKLTLPQTKLIT